MRSVENVAGIDVHKMMLVVVVGRTDQDEKEWMGRKFGTTRRELEHLRAWLEEQSVREVAMESTAQYWKPVWLTLEGISNCTWHKPDRRPAPKGGRRIFGTRYESSSDCWLTI